jgi:aquaporin Z
VGALLAVGLFRLLSMFGMHDVLTAKMFHTPHYRSIFKNVKAPQVSVNENDKMSMLWRNP